MVLRVYSRDPHVASLLRMTYRGKIAPQDDIQVGVVHYAGGTFVVGYLGFK